MNRTFDEPSYRKLHCSGELENRGRQALATLAECRLCPRECGLNRLAGQRGPCGYAAEVYVASWNLHPWEEPPISGRAGSGTVFFSGCSGRCLFCQNYPISQLGVGQPASIERLGEMMLELQQRGAHNINLVTGAHFVPQFLLALDRAAGDGLNIPIVYNSSGYERVKTLRLLEDVVDIFLPDAKYADNRPAEEFSGFRRYVEVNRAALGEIFRQVGAELIIDAGGIARKGLIIRHMVLPHNLAGSEVTFRWIADSLSPAVHVSLMNQYFPAHNALNHPLLGRKITMEEYEGAIEAFFEAGLSLGWSQECEILEELSPDEDEGHEETREQENPQVARIRCQATE